MTAALVLILAAALLALGALADLLPGPTVAGPLATPSGRGRRVGGWRTLAVVDARLGLSARLARAGLSERVSVRGPARRPRSAVRWQGSSGPW